MGYLIAAHVTKSEPDLAQLETLPTNLAWAVYRDDDASAWYVDTFVTGEKHEWPFTYVPDCKDLPRDLPDNLGQLSRVYAALKVARLADSFDRTLLNLNLLLSSTLKIPVLSFCSDDDGLDFACMSQGGTLLRLHCECGDISITYREGKIEIQPLRFDNDDDMELTDLTDLHDPANGIFVLDRDKNHTGRLHFIASEEVLSFLGTSSPPLGLGCFDGIEMPPIKIAMSAQSSANAQSKSQIKPWWRFWGRQ